MDAVEVDGERLQRAEAEPRCDGRAEGVEAAHHGRGQRRHDEQRVAAGTSGTSGAIRIPASPQTTKLITQLISAIRSGESPLTSAPDLGLGRGPGGEPEAGEPEDDGQHDPQPMMVAAKQSRSTEMSDAENREVVLREDRVHQDELPFRPGRSRGR